jgi:hypothetical protein
MRETSEGERKTKQGGTRREGERAGGKGEEREKKGVEEGLFPSSPDPRERFGGERESWS